MLSEYEYEIQHRPGVKMVYIDALSRALVNDSTDTKKELETYEVMIAMTEEELVLSMQRVTLNCEPSLKYFEQND